MPHGCVEPLLSARRRSLSAGWRGRVALPALAIQALLVRLLPAVAVAILLAAPAAAAVGTSPTAAELLTELVALGPRVPGSAAHRAAGEWLLQRLRQIPGVEARPVSFAAGVVNIEGRLAGRGDQEVVLAAHYDTVPGSPGAFDNASSCVVLLQVAATLAEEPLQHAVRVVFTDAEEIDGRGARELLETAGDGGRERMLAALQLDSVALRAQESASILSLAAGDRASPAWLVHAALQASRTVDFQLDFAGPSRSLRTQLLLRLNATRYASDSELFLDAGVPSILLTDFPVWAPPEQYHRPTDVLAGVETSRLDDWSRFTTAVVRRLQGLEGRPRWHEDYLVLGRRVWIGRDLLWLGLLLWIPLVFRGRPGAWRGTATSTRAERGRLYVPGFVFRALFLVAALLQPLAATLLVYPMGPLALWTPPSRWGRSLWQCLSLLPLAAFLAIVGGAAGVGFLGEWTVEPLLPVLVLGTLAAFSWQLWAPPQSPPSS